LRRRANVSARGRVVEECPHVRHDDKAAYRRAEKPYLRVDEAVKLATFADLARAVRDTAKS
jgi:hypothetical protein